MDGHPTIAPAHVRLFGIPCYCREVRSNVVFGRPMMPASNSTAAQRPPRPSAYGAKLVWAFLGPRLLTPHGAVAHQYLALAVPP